MNLKRNTVLASAVAVALGFGGGTALAAGSISVTAPLFAQEITAPASLTSAAPIGALGFGVSAGQSVYLRFNLSNDGATFSAAPTLMTGTGTGTIGGTLVSGGAGNGFVIFQVTAPTRSLSDLASEHDLYDTSSNKS